MLNRGRIANLARYIFVDGQMGRLRFFSTCAVCIGTPIVVGLIVLLILFGIHFVMVEFYGKEDVAISVDLNLEYPLVATWLTYFGRSVLFGSTAIILLAGIPRMRSMGLGENKIINLLYIAAAMLFLLESTVSFGFWRFAVEWERILQQIVFSTIGSSILVIFWLWLLCLLFLPVGVFANRKTET